MEYKHCCVIDAAGAYQTLVLVETTKSGEERILYYELKEGERLLDEKAPMKKFHAESTGLIKPVWDGAAWTEGATTEEAAAWDQERPAPEEPGPTTEDILGQEIVKIKLELMGLKGGM